MSPRVAVCEQMPAALLGTVTRWKVVPLTRIDSQGKMPNATQLLLNVRLKLPVVEVSQVAVPLTSLHVTVLPPTVVRFDTPPWMALTCVGFGITCSGTSSSTAIAIEGTASAAAVTTKGRAA
jgi:hypothetical protein